MPPSFIVLDSGAVTFLAQASSRAEQLLSNVRRYGSPRVLSPTLLECLPAAPRDARVNQFLKHCHIITDIPVGLVRVANMARREAGRGSALDALVVACAVGGAVITGDRDDFKALAAHLPDVTVVTI